MSRERITWIRGKMFFPSDIDPADIDWVEPLNPQQQLEQEMTVNTSTDMVV